MRRRFGSKAMSTRRRRLAFVGVLLALVAIATVSILRTARLVPTAAPGEALAQPVLRASAPPPVAKAVSVPVKDAVAQPEAVAAQAAPSPPPVMRAPHDPPEWCAQLIASPRGSPLQRPCVRPHLDDLCSDGKPAFFGQLNHDVYLYLHHFRHLKRPGVYLDLAANHAKLISNTYFMDTCLGWKGVCVEANKWYFPELIQWRTCQLIPTCVSDRVEDVEFMLYEGLSGIADTNKNMHEFKEGWLRGRVGSTRMTCVIIKDELAKRDVQKFDYLSLDLEGHELKALQGIDWDKTYIGIISLEAPPDSPVSKYLLEKGYKRHDPILSPTDPLAITGDEIYIASDVEFGEPV